MSTAPFTDSIDYPGEMLIDGPREGVFYDYAGSWYLDGIVNFTDPLRAFMLMRYEDRDNSDCAVGWVAHTEANLAAMLSWVAETADNAFANYQPEATRPEGGVLLEIPKMARCVQW